MAPAEAVRMAKLAGLRAVTFTERVDAATMHPVLNQLAPVARSLSLYAGIDVIAGCELAYMPSALLPDAIAEARAAGAQFVAVLGQYLSGHVEEGTNLAAIEGGCDLLSSPGLITEEEAVLAAEKNCMLDVTAYSPHALANGHVVRMSRATGARIAVTGGVHEAIAFISADLRRAVGIGAGMTADEYATSRSHINALLSRMLRM